MTGIKAEENTAFPRLSEAEIAELDKIGTRQRLRDGDVLFEAGEERCGFFVVLAGAIKVVDGSGDEVQIVSIHKPREFTGDVDVLGERRAMVSTVAQGDTEVLHISTDDLNHILSEQPALGETILNAFIERRELLVDSGFQGLRVIGSAGLAPSFSALRISGSQPSSLHLAQGRDGARSRSTAGRTWCCGRGSPCGGVWRPAAPA